MASAPSAERHRDDANGSERRTILDGWVAELDDGREIAVRGLVLLGRNPQPGEGEADELVEAVPAVDVGEPDRREKHVGHGLDPEAVDAVTRPDGLA